VGDEEFLEEARSKLGATCTRASLLLLPRGSFTM